MGLLAFTALAVPTISTESLEQTFLDNDDECRDEACAVNLLQRRSNNSKSVIAASQAADTQAMLPEGVDPSLLEEKPEESRGAALVDEQLEEDEDKNRDEEEKME